MTFKNLSPGEWTLHVVAAVVASAAAVGLTGFLWLFPVMLLSYFVFTPFFEWFGPKFRNAHEAFDAWRIRRERRR